MSPNLLDLCYKMLEEENKCRGPIEVCRKPTIEETQRAWWCVQGRSDEGDAAASLVDLPHVQLLVLLQGLLELGGGEATRDAALLRFSHADHAAGSTSAGYALRGELAHQREDDVGRALSPERKEFRV